MNRDPAHYAQQSQESRIPAEKERKWKIHEEKQKAKQNARIKRLDFARPVSATEPWKTGGCSGGGGGDKRRPISARVEGDYHHHHHHHHHQHQNPGFGKKTSPMASWRTPAEGEGDGLKEEEDESKESQSHAFTELLSSTSGTSLDEDEDIEDFLVADNDHVISRTPSGRAEEEKTFIGDAIEAMKDDASAEIVDRVGGSGSGSSGRGANEGTRDSYETDHRAADAIFTPLIPINHENELFDGEQVARNGEEEDSIVVLTTSGNPTIRDLDLDDDDHENNKDDDDDDGYHERDEERVVEATATTKADEEDDENDVVDATIEATAENGPEENDDSAAEREAAEHLMTMDGRREEFMLQPVPQKLRRAFRCRVTRRETGYYEMRAESPSGFQLLMTAKKKKAAPATTYVFFCGAADDENDAAGNNKKPPPELGGMRANLLGTNFTVTRNRNHYHHHHYHHHRGEKSQSSGIESELAVITYEPNILGLKGPRRIGIVIPGMTTDGSRVALKSREPNDSIVARMRNNATSHLIKMENKTPTWNDESQSFVLNFRGRVTMASIKNFQIVHSHDPDYIVFQFGRVSDNLFTLDFRYPLCPLQAFGCALSSMNRKLACE